MAERQGGTDPKASEVSQLDRIEQSLSHIGNQLGKILERLARMEQRQDSQAAEIEAHRAQIEEHGQRLRTLEVNHAVVESQAKSTGRQSDRRWSALGAVGLVLLGSGLTLAGYLIVHFMGG